MRLARAAVFAAILAALLAVPMLAPPAAAADEGDTVSVYGYVSDISNSDGNVPLAGVSVTLLDVSRLPVATVVTGDDGRFEFTFTYTGAVYLDFDYGGYTVRTVPGSDMYQLGESLVGFTLDGLTPDSDGKYALSGDGYSPSAFGMAATEGYVYGFVYGYQGDDAVALDGAVVTIVSSSGRTYTATTDRDGWFEASVEYGSCTVSVSCSGFKGSGSFEADTNDASALYVYLEEREGGILGLDTPHELMVLGLIVIGIVLLGVYILLWRSKGSDSGVTVVDDLEDEENP